MKLKLFITTFIFIPIFETLFVSIYFSELYAPLFLIWIIGSWYFQLSYKTTLSLAAWYLIFALIFLFRGESFYANRLAIWFYLFFSLSFGFAVLEKIGLKKRINEKVSPFSALQIVLNYLIFRSKYLIFVLIFALMAIIYYELQNQARYYYWFFTFDKFEKYFKSTAIYEIIFFVILFFIFYKISRWRINKRFLSIIFLISLFLGNILIFRFTTRSIQINGDEPIISEIREKDDLVFLYGHNFRRWPDEHAVVYIDENFQDIVFWSSDLIVLKPSAKKEDRKLIWVVNPLKLASKKMRIDQFK